MPLVPNIRPVLQEEFTRFKEATLRPEFDTLGERIEQAVQVHISTCSGQLLEAIRDLGERVDAVAAVGVRAEMPRQLSATRPIYSSEVSGGAEPHKKGMRKSYMVQQHRRKVSAGSGGAPAGFFMDDEPLSVDRNRISKTAVGSPGMLTPASSKVTSRSTSHQSRELELTSVPPKSRLSVASNLELSVVPTHFRRAGSADLALLPSSSTQERPLPQRHTQSMPVSSGSRRTRVTKQPSNRLTMRRHASAGLEGQDVFRPMEQFLSPSCAEDASSDSDGESSDQGHDHRQRRRISLLSVREELEEDNAGAWASDGMCDANPLVAWVLSPWFDWGAGILVILYALFLGVQTNYTAEHWPESRDDRVRGVLEIVHSVFIGFFVLEFLLRLYATGWDFWIGRAAGWNIFDCVIIFTVCVEPILDIFKGAGNHPDNVTGILRTVRIVRLVRTLRLVRMVYLIQELHTVLMSIVFAMRSLLWTVMLMLIFMYIVAICMTQLATECEDASFPRQLFGSIATTMMTLYAVTTNGLSWHDLVPQLMGCSALLVFLLLLYITVMLFGLMNVVTSLFVKSVMETTESSNRATLMQNMYQLFHSTDAEDTGTITAAAFGSYLEDARMQAYLKDIDLAPDDAQELFDLLDMHGDGEITTEDFLTGIMRLHGYAKAINLETFNREYKQQKADNARFCFFVEASLKQMEVELKQVMDSLTLMFEPSRIDKTPTLTRQNQVMLS